VLTTLTLGVLTTLVLNGGIPAASAVHESPPQPTNDRIAVNIMFRFFIVLFAFWFVFGRLWLLTLRSPFRPFTDLLPQPSPPVASGELRGKVLFENCWWLRPN